MTINKKPTRTGMSGCNGKLKEFRIPRLTFIPPNEIDVDKYLDAWSQSGQIYYSPTKEIDGCDIHDNHIKSGGRERWIIHGKL